MLTGRHGDLCKGSGTFECPHRDADTIMALDRPAELTVSIFDCFNGKTINPDPSRLTAPALQSCPNLPPFEQSDHPYSYELVRFLTVRNPNVLVEDLGNEEIQQFKARGVRLTWRGTEKGGQWNGRAVRAMEQWRSDKLRATLLWVCSDFTKQVEDRAALTNIRRKEPDASLFTIPAGYNITYWK